MRNLKLTVEYDGAAYHGWQRQKDCPTVQQLLEDSLTRITGERVSVLGSGRTDAGVHALNQTAHFKTDSSIAVKSLQAAINSMLPSDVAVKEVEEVEEFFHARYCVKSKIYFYQIFNHPVRSVQYRHCAWHLRGDLDLNGMERGLSFLLGRHDFSSFCGKKNNDNCVRTIMDGRLEGMNGGLIRIYLQADGFLRYMVRTIVGTLVEVGRGKRRADEVPDILAAKDRSQAGMTAPALGLFLAEVKY